MSENKQDTAKENEDTERGHDRVDSTYWTGTQTFTFDNLNKFALREDDWKRGVLSFETRLKSIDEKNEPLGHNGGPALDDEPKTELAPNPNVAQEKATRLTKDRDAHQAWYKTPHIFVSPRGLPDPNRFKSNAPKTSFLDALADLSASTSDLIHSWIAPKAQVADTFLLFVCTPDDAEASVGDLMEAYDAVAARKSAWISNIWFVWELSLLVAAKGRKRIVKATLGPLLNRILKGKAG